MTVRSDFNRRQLHATAAEMQSLADLIGKYPAETQLIMQAYEDGLTLGPMQAMDPDDAPSEAAHEPPDSEGGVFVTTEPQGIADWLIRERAHRIDQGDLCEFAEVTDEGKAAGRLNVEENHWGVLPAAQIAESLGVAHKGGPPTLDDLRIPVDPRLGRIVYEQTRFAEVFRHGPTPEPQVPPEGADADSLRAALAAVVGQVRILDKIGGMYRFGACDSSDDRLRRADFQGQAMAYKMAAIRLADVLTKAGGLVEAKQRHLQGQTEQDDESGSA